MKKRYIQKQVLSDLTKKMVFIGGPRQVGKTTFAQTLHPNPAYLNWDIDEDRTSILDMNLGQNQLLIFDEIHKYKKWRNYLKGIFDAMKARKRIQQQILVTGSARLDYYRYSGDSLQGRYHYLRLMPLSYAELDPTGGAELLDMLMRLSGFPEPFFSSSEIDRKRWSREYRARLIREDVRTLEQVNDLASMELLAGRLPECVGGPFSLNAVREDLRIAHATAAKWVTSLENMYYIFRVPPFGPPKVKAIQKEPKLYCYDWTLVNEESFRFENLIAVHLQKYVYWLQDSEGRDLELRYFRDRSDHEVDFVVLENKKPILLVECKRHEDALSSSLRFLSQRYPGVPAFQVHLHGERDRLTQEGIRICPAFKLLETLI